VELGVVADPLHAELFLGVLGQGAWCNGGPIRVSTTTRLARTFLGIVLPNRAAPVAGSLGRTFGRFAARCPGVRDRGAGALDLCYVACGRLDGYWEIARSPWDVAAGSLIVTEAGGRMSDFRGGRFDIFGGETVASNGKIHRQMLAVLGMPGGFPKRYVPPVSRRVVDALGRSATSTRGCPQRAMSARSAGEHPEAAGYRGARTVVEGANQ
jgi:myo-inositol-1(or 4)-monophosphatase